MKIVGEISEKQHFCINRDLNCQTRRIKGLLAAAGGYVERRV
jgi:hypothetical protein